MILILKIIALRLPSMVIFNWFANKSTRFYSMTEYFLSKSSTL